MVAVTFFVTFVLFINICGVVSLPSYRVVVEIGLKMQIKVETEAVSILKK